MVIEMSYYLHNRMVVWLQTICLATMSATDSMDSHQAENSQNYITVIPVEYPRSRVYPQAPEYVVDQYRYNEFKSDVYSFPFTIWK